jgi:hypothetical protein
MEGGLPARLPRTNLTSSEMMLPFATTPSHILLPSWQGDNDSVAPGRGGRRNRNEVLQTVALEFLGGETQAFREDLVGRQTPGIGWI